MSVLSVPAWLESPAGEPWQVDIMQAVDTLRIAEVELRLPVRGYILSLSKMVIANTIDEDILKDVVKFLDAKEYAGIIPLQRAKKLLQKNIDS